MVAEFKICEFEAIGDRDYNNSVRLVDLSSLSQFNQCRERLSSASQFAVDDSLTTVSPLQLGRRLQSALWLFPHCDLRVSSRPVVAPVHFQHW